VNIPRKKWKKTKKKKKKRKDCWTLKGPTEQRVQRDREEGGTRGKRREKKESAKKEREAACSQKTSKVGDRRRDKKPRIGIRKPTNRKSLGRSKGGKLRGKITKIRKKGEKLKRKKKGNYQTSHRKVLRKELKNV